MIVFSGCLMRCRCIIGPSVHGPQSARNRPAARNRPVFASARGPQSARVRFGPRPEIGPPGGGIDPELRQPWPCWSHGWTG